MFVLLRWKTMASEVGTGWHGWSLHHSEWRARVTRITQDVDVVIWRSDQLHLNDRMNPCQTPDILCMVTRRVERCVLVQFTCKCFFVFAQFACKVRNQWTKTTNKTYPPEYSAWAANIQEPRNVLPHKSVPEHSGGRTGHHFIEQRSPDLQSDVGQRPIGEIVRVKQKLPERSGHQRLLCIYPWLFSSGR